MNKMLQRCLSILRHLNSLGFIEFSRAANYGLGQDYKYLQERELIIERVETRQYYITEKGKRVYETFRELMEE